MDVGAGAAVRRARDFVVLLVIATVVWIVRMIGDGEEDE